MCRVESEYSAENQGIFITGAWPSIRLIDTRPNINAFEIRTSGDVPGGLFFALHLMWSSYFDVVDTRTRRAM